MCLIFFYYRAELTSEHERGFLALGLGGANVKLNRVVGNIFFLMRFHATLFVLILTVMNLIGLLEARQLIKVNLLVSVNCPIQEGLVISFTVKGRRGMFKFYEEALI